jgi:hypothetical protein
MTTRTKQNARLMAASERDIALRPVREPVDWGALKRLATFAAERRAEMGEDRWAQLNAEWENPHV